MEKMVAHLQEYVRTYSDQACYRDYSDKTFIDDVLYGLGIAFGEQYHGATGYTKFRDVLRQHLNSP
jgi:hypothetical protein